MNTLKNLLPILTAVISAIALIGGYVYQKDQDRKAEIRKTRQEIYSRLISNITQRNEILGRLLEQFPEYVKVKDKPDERRRVEQELSAAGRLTSPELSKNEGQRTEVVAALCLYGPDEAIDAYAKYATANMGRREGGDVGQLILDLRRSIDRKTHITAEQADLAIWMDPKYLTEASKAR
ncbi:MAG TPA: hypothetical protein VEJ46_04495 [Candidatus Acidoferrum sp.]|nr:hypothetical protein [Candidatus Acidoferrum sp.]